MTKGISCVKTLENLPSVSSPFNIKYLVNCLIVFKVEEHCPSTPQWFFEKVKRKVQGIQQSQKKVRQKSRECHNHKPQPFPDPKRKRKPTNLNKHKPNKRTKSTKISSLFPKRGNRNTKRTEKHKNKMTHGKTYSKSPRRINHKATKSKQPFPDTKRNRTQTKQNERKSNKLSLPQARQSQC